MLQKKVNELNELVKSLDSIEALNFIADKFKGKIVFTTSFGYEDQVITDMIFENNINIDVVTLDTGRLFKETYKVYSQTLDNYKKPIKTYFPQNEAVEKMVSAKGPYSFYNSIDNRKECCTIRKVELLNRALDGVELWITGIRAEQSQNREGMTFFELDESRQIIKYNPLLHFSFEEVKKYVKENHVPYNVLHDKGYVSIGCEPCTRAINPGDDFRAGRWWWESNSKKECGLHTH
ncbi:MAG: phosphoadenylyl-sulfate reductase [Salinivirgaceae bacterium]|jgi:phosphoadenosine phosphosulfate reductase|nr:phosphoadenylyl-sulfate reductase [Salinivirgaceae bacterium]